MAFVRLTQAFQLPTIKTPSQPPSPRKAEEVLPPSCLRSLQRFDSLLQDLVSQEQVLSTRLQTVTQDLLLVKTCIREIVAKGIKRQRKLPAATEQCPGRWRWRLVATSAIPKVVCKGKYFAFQIRLEPLTDVQLSPDLTLSLRAQLFASDSPLEPISLNMNGEPIMRGDECVDLVYDHAQCTHVAQFNLQITEVSSHYVNGWLRLSIATEAGSPFAGLLEPLRVDSIVVRAKEKTCRRFKERELTGQRQQRLKRFPTTL